MKPIREWCDERQKDWLDILFQQSRTFAEGNDNIVTQALQGLLSELSKNGFNAPIYLTEKVEIIIRAMRRAE